MSDHALAVWSVCTAFGTAVIAVVGVLVAYLGLRSTTEQVRLMRAEQRARQESESALVATSEGPMLVGGPLGRLLNGVTERLYGGR
jgi:hypothetical protein